MATPAPSGVILNKPLALIEPYSGNSLAGSGIVAGLIIGRWADSTDGFPTGSYVSFMKEDALEVKQGGDNFYLIDENKILFSFTVS